MGAVETVGDSQNGREHLDDATIPLLEFRVHAVAIIGDRAPVIPSDTSDDPALSEGEGQTSRLEDLLEGGLVVATPPLQPADVMEDARIQKPATLCVAKAVNTAQLVEESQSKPGDLVGMAHFVVRGRSQGEALLEPEQMLSRSSRAPSDEARDRSVGLFEACPKKEHLSVGLRQPSISDCGDFRLQFERDTALHYLKPRRP
jgi:hypothetical protein